MGVLLRIILITVVYCIFGAEIAQAQMCPAGTNTSTSTFHVVSATGGNNPNGAVGAPLFEGSVVTNESVSGVTFFPTVTYDLTGDPDVFVPEGEVIDISLTQHFGGGARAEILMSLDGTTYTSLGTTGTGGSVFGAWTANTFRYDAFTVPAGGARFIQIDHQMGGVRFDGVTFSSLCLPGVAIEVIAASDNGSVADASLGNISVLNVLDNDTIDGNAPPTDFDLSLVPGTTLPAGLIFDTATGVVEVLQGTVTGVYSFDYTLCQDSNLLNCDIATVTLNVTNPNPPLICPAGSSLSTGTFHVVSATGGNNPNGAVGAPLPEGSVVTNETVSGVTFFPTVTYDLTGDPDIFVAEGQVIDISLTQHFNNGARAEILMSADGMNYTSLGTTGTGGSVFGNWTANTFRYDGFTVPAGGARFIQVNHETGGVRFDGVIYSAQCSSGSGPELSASKTITMFDSTAYAVPGNDVVYTITVSNNGSGSVDNNTLELIDAMPAQVAYFNDDLDGDGPETNAVSFSDNGSGLTFDFLTDVGFSDSTTGPPSSFADCNYTPIANNYDSAVTFICFNPNGEMNAMSSLNLSFRAQIE